VEIVHVWIAGLAGLRGTGQQCRDHAGLCRPEGHDPAEIVNVCGSLVWQALRAWSRRDRVGLRGGSLGWHGPGRAEEQAQGLEILRPAEQQLCGPMGQGLVCSASYSFSILWCEEAFHKLGVQSADVSALSPSLPQPSVSSASQQSSWFMELRKSVAASQSPSWISPPDLLLARLVCYFLSLVWRCKLATTNS
jgi:hypothetical protein